MKKKKTIIQIAAGFLPIFILWFLGAYYGDSFFPDPLSARDIDFNRGTEIIPLIVVRIIPILLLVSAVVGERFNLKALYISSVLAVGLPVVSMVCGDVFSDDSNILSWIFAFTLALPMMPFGKVGYSTFDGIDMYLFIHEERFLNRELLMLSLAVVIVVSVIIYVAVKPEKTIQETAEQFTDA